jgi:hypothetical protein
MMITKNTLTSKQAHTLVDYGTVEDYVQIGGEKVTGSTVGLIRANKMFKRISDGKILRINYTIVMKDHSIRPIVVDSDVTFYDVAS